MFGDWADWEAELAEKNQLNMELLECRQKLSERSKDAEILARYSSDLSSDARLLATLTHRLDANQLEIQRWRLDASMWQRESHRLSRSQHRQQQSASPLKQFEELQRSLQAQMQQEAADKATAVEEREQIEREHAHSVFAHHEPNDAARDSGATGESAATSFFGDSRVDISRISSRHVSPSPGPAHIPPPSILPPVSSAGSLTRLASLTAASAKMLPMESGAFSDAGSATISSRKSASEPAHAHAHSTSKSALAASISSLLRETEGEYNAAVKALPAPAPPSVDDLTRLAKSFAGKSGSAAALPASIVSVGAPLAAEAPTAPAARATNAMVNSSVKFDASAASDSRRDDSTPQSSHASLTAPLPALFADSAAPPSASSSHSLGFSISPHELNSRSVDLSRSRALYALRNSVAAAAPPAVGSPAAILLGAEGGLTAAGASATAPWRARLERLSGEVDQKLAHSVTASQWGKFDA